MAHYISARELRKDRRDEAKEAERIRALEKEIELEKMAIRQRSLPARSHDSEYIDRYQQDRRRDEDEADRSILERDSAKMSAFFQKLKSTRESLRDDRSDNSEDVFREENSRKSEIETAIDRNSGRHESDEHHLSPSMTEFFQTIDRYDRCSTRRESKKEEISEVSEQIIQLERRLKSMQEEKDRMKERQTVKTQDDLSDRYTHDTFIKEIEDYDRSIHQKEDRKSKEETMEKEIVRRREHMNQEAAMQRNSQGTLRKTEDRLRDPYPSQAQEWYKETRFLDEDRDRLPDETELYIKKDMLDTKYRNKRDTFKDYNTLIEEEERHLDNMLQEEEDTIQKLIKKEQLLDETHEKQKEEEKMLEERMRIVQLKAQELVCQREKRALLEKRIKEKEEEAYRQDAKLRNFRQREKEIETLHIREEDTNIGRYRPHIREEDIQIVRNTQKVKDEPERKEIKSLQDSEVKRETVDPEPSRYYGKPHIPPFDGSSFEEWKLEVTCLLNSKMYPQNIITQSVRNSLKGPTRKVLITLGENVGTEEIVKKLEEIYGRTETEDAAWQDFFTSAQKENESSSSWAIRLESLLQYAAKGEDISDSRKNKMLKTRFWKGLKSERLRNATRVSFESEDTFEKLIGKVRKEEKDLSTDTKRTENRNITKEPEENAQMNMMKDLMDRLKRIEEELHKERDTRQYIDNKERPSNDRQNRFNRYKEQNYRNQPWRQNRENRNYNRQHDNQDTNTKKEDTKKTQEDRPLNY